ncbi:hypothetical protein BGZ99_009413 [Dissophora globulifera]|uniref:RRM domain-containing protein n=1 Tax=Dissophora globulifera TaxID=979702 RepID=A0A9P6RU95_9FUNG|nr:hypothetical protein BGZ99_009413 [Dissophora globulifera]
MVAGANTLAARAYATKKLFVGNIAWGTTDQEVTEFFSQYGELKDVYFPKDPMGRTKGYGFIELEDVEADKAIEEANGREFNGRELRVDAATGRPEGQGRPPRGDFQGEFRPRREFNRDGGRDGGRQFRPRREFNRDGQNGGDRPYRPRRDDGGDRSFRRRDDNEGRE